MFGKKQPGGALPASPAFQQAQTSISPSASMTASMAASTAPLPASASSPATTRVEASGIALPPGLAALANRTVEPDRLSYIDVKLETPDFKKARRQLLAEMADKLDVAALERMDHDTKHRRVVEYADTILPSILIPLTAQQMRVLRDQSADELLGFGPIEPLLNDPDVADILINGAKQVYIEKRGKLYLTDVTFMDEGHLLGIIQRIVSRVGRRVDEANPMVDARMPDGSRFNAIIPPLALDGCLVSIRKFKKSKMSLIDYPGMGSMSMAMCQFLAIASNVRLNIIVSGGTGSGKTTLLNALSGFIDHGERIVTIEDAAELQLMQPHVLRLETRPASIEGKGEVTQRQLVKNALRMRPDRIILGEMRGDEVIDMLSAMNTGHDGSMGTIHANTPRDALARIENLVAMSAVAVSQTSVRAQMASALNLIVQIQRMRDGKRRVTNIDEISGAEGSNILMQPLFSYKINGIAEDGTLNGEYVCHTMRPYVVSRAEMFGRDKEMLECFRTQM